MAAPFVGWLRGEYRLEARRDSSAIDGGGVTHRAAKSQALACLPVHCDRRNPDAASGGPGSATCGFRGRLYCDLK
jgi:hypothetical protein